MITVLITVFLFQAFINLLSFRFLPERLIRTYKRLLFGLILIIVVGLIVTEVKTSSSWGNPAEDIRNHGFAMDITNLVYYSPILLLVIIVQILFNSYLYKYIMRDKKGISH
jgi:hypothetical protein